MVRGKRDTAQNISCTVVYGFTPHFMLYHGYLDYFFNSVGSLFYYSISEDTWEENLILLNYFFL